MTTIDDSDCPLHVRLHPDEKCTCPQKPPGNHLPPGNWHAIEGPNGMCACGPINGCPERLNAHIANLLDDERNSVLEEIPDVWRRSPGTLVEKVRAMVSFFASDSVPTPQNE